MQSRIAVNTSPWAKVFFTSIKPYICHIPHSVPQRVWGLEVLIASPPLVIVQMMP